MKKWLILAAVVALAVLVYVAAGPYITMHRIEKSIANQDYDALTAQIDFPAIRDDLGRQLERKIDAETPEFLDNVPFIGKAVNALGAKILEQTIEPLMIGQLLYIMQGNAPDLDFGLSELAKPNTIPQSTSTDKVFEAAETDYIDHRTFVASVAHAETGVYRFTFTRRGLHWKLSGISVPMLAVETP
jgi:Protein of unknown function (DUF2939)